jgi:hypothetical protein
MSVSDFLSFEVLCFLDVYRKTLRDATYDLLLLCARILI